ncbi:hypothetical protein YC2023_066442 [Brassica napus]
MLSCVQAGEVLARGILGPVRLGSVDLKRKDSAGVKHLQNLADADTSVLEGLPPDSAEAQARITEIKNDDGFNWGYNHVLWGVPKGSYASDPTGPCRIIEFRKMVQALNFIGLNVFLDFVYNHLHANGPHDKDSVLDKVDGFRFDLMGHIMKDTMVKAKSAIGNLRKETDEVDGSRIYIYGEGWNFGKVANNGRGVNASQFNLTGTGIGSFNDRIRDATLGGSIWSSSSTRIRYRCIAFLRYDVASEREYRCFIASP